MLCAVASPRDNGFSMMTLWHKRRKLTDRYMALCVWSFFFSEFLISWTVLFISLLFFFPSTRETLASGHFMSVINILMQLRKVCNHPNLFDPRPIQSPFITQPIVFHTASLVQDALEVPPLKVRSFNMRENLVFLINSKLDLI